jgi:Cu+-exporting ATPase
MVKLPTDKSASESVEDDNRSMANVPSSAAKPTYTCPMHPEIQQDHPGNCPKCGMTLEPKTVTTGTDEAENADLRDMTRR